MEDARRFGLSPCYECPDRRPGCHDRCSRYAEFKANVKAINKKINDDKIQSTARKVTTPVVFRSK